MPISFYPMELLCQLGLVIITQMLTITRIGLAIGRIIPKVCQRVFGAKIEDNSNKS